LADDTANIYFKPDRSSVRFRIHLIPHVVFELQAALAERPAHGAQAIGFSADLDQQDGDGGPTAVAGERLVALTLFVAAGALSATLGLQAGRTHAIDAFEVDASTASAVGCDRFGRIGHGAFSLYRKFFGMQ